MTDHLRGLIVIAVCGRQCSSPSNLRRMDTEPEKTDFPSIQLGSRLGWDSVFADLWEQDCPSRKGVWI